MNVAETYIFFVHALLLSRRIVFCYKKNIYVCIVNCKIPYDLRVRQLQKIRQSRLLRLRPACLLQTV